MDACLRFSPIRAQPKPVMPHPSPSPSEHASANARPLRAEGRRLGIIAGGGAIPAAVAEAALNHYEHVFIVGLQGHAGEEIARFPHAFASFGQVGRMLRLLLQSRCDDVVLVGHLRRPDLWSLRPDAGAIRHLPKLVKFLKGGDDHLLKRIGRFFESQGFRVRGAHEVAPQLVAPAGTFSRAAPSPRDIEDLQIGAKIIGALSPFDVGQAVVVSRAYVLAIEAAEGTDAMLSRCGDLRTWGLKGRSGVLVKTPKMGQDIRLDMPAIGPRTVELAGAAGLSGIAVAAGHVLLAEQAALIEKADAAGLFLYGFDTGALTGKAAGSASGYDNSSQRE